MTLNVLMPGQVALKGKGELELAVHLEVRQGHLRVLRCFTQAVTAHLPNSGWGFNLGTCVVL